jgi:hypothetical protein
MNLQAQLDLLESLHKGCAVIDKAFQYEAAFIRGLHLLVMFSLAMDCRARTRVLRSSDESRAEKLVVGGG